MGETQRQDRRSTHVIHQAHCDHEPHRTGAASDGEWLHINGAQWQEVKRILVFAFIYEGAPNWSETDGVVTILIPGQPPIEVRLNEEGGRHGMCAIALLENDRGAVKVAYRFAKKLFPVWPKLHGNHFFVRRDELQGELYRAGEEFKFKAIGQGFVGGLKPLAQAHGVSVG